MWVIGDTHQLKMELFIEVTPRDAMCVATTASPSYIPITATVSYSHIPVTTTASSSYIPITTTANSSRISITSINSSMTSSKLYVRSVLPKIDEIRLTCLSYNLDILALAETWLSPDVSDTEVAIPNYALFRLDRNRHGGGVAIYVHNSISAQSILLPHIPELELILAITTRLSTFTIGVYYRPPNRNDSLQIFHDTISLLNPSLIHHCVIFGDFNVNMLDPLHSLRHNINVILDSFNLHQIVTDATHYSTQGACVPSLLDLILVSDLNLVRFHRVLPCISNSDHNAVFCSLNLQLSNTFPRKYIREQEYIWCFSSADWCEAVRCIQETDWDQLISDCDIDSAWNAWKSEFTKIISDTVPRKFIMTHPSVPWITHAMIRKRNSYYHRGKQFNSPFYFQKYKAIRNEITNNLRRAKKDFFIFM